jgi:hypothetical protein
MRITLSRSVAIAVAAGVLVVGTDFATFGVTGNSMILGHFNSAHATTTLTNRAGGPALRLRNARAGYPPLAVNSDKVVRHLNADALDGRTATDLTSHAITFSAGRRGERIPRTRLWNLPVEPGLYELSFKAAIIPRRGSVQAPVQAICGVADLLTFGPRTHIYTADSATYIGDFPAVMSGAEVVRIRSAQQPALICTTAGNTAGVNFRLFQAVTASFTRINSREVRSAQPLPNPTGKNAGQRAFSSH